MHDLGIKLIFFFYFKHVLCLYNLECCNRKHHTIQLFCIPSFIRILREYVVAIKYKIEVKVINESVVHFYYICQWVTNLFEIKFFLLSNLYQYVIRKENKICCNMEV